MPDGALSRLQSGWLRMSGAGYVHGCRRVSRSRERLNHQRACTNNQRMWHGGDACFHGCQMGLCGSVVCGPGRTEVTATSQQWLGRPMGRDTGGGEVCLSLLKVTALHRGQHDMYSRTCMCSVCDCVSCDRHETITPNSGVKSDKHFHIELFTQQPSERT